MEYWNGGIMLEHENTFFIWTLSFNIYHFVF
jgi:hypothetical protein